MAEKICDMHCHVLPGIDDGAKTMEESLQTLREAAKQGIESIIVTPHFHPGRYVADAELVMKSLAALKAESEKLEIPIRMFPGQECFYYSGLLDELERGRALTLAGSRYVLVEFSPDVLYSYMTRGLQELQHGGYHPILAHFERYECIRQEDRLKELKERGILLQMNFDMLLQKDSLFRKNPWRRLARQGAADYFGSDCHGMEFRPYHVAESLKWLETNLDPSLRHRILKRNIRTILQNK